jgi:hypothetical protein
MLSVTGYSQDYIDKCRARITEQITAYHNLSHTARVQATNAPSHEAAEIFEAGFFNHLVLLLDYMFVHRSRTMEKKDGKVLNEVRLLCQCLLENDGVLVADKTLKLNPAKTVLKLEPGDEICLNEADFVRLADAYFAEIEQKFGQAVTVEA